MNWTRDNQGFTLIELLVSMTIVALVVAIVAEAFLLGYRSWEGGKKAVEHELRLRTAIDIISKQLRSTYPLSAEEGVFFYGDSRSLNFVTTLPMGFEKRGGLFRINYLIEDDAATGRMVLKASQRPAYFEGPIEDIGKGFAVLAGLREADWGYYKEGVWLEEWEEGEKLTPEKVRLTLQFEDGAGGVYETVVPVLAGLKAEKERPRS